MRFCKTVFALGALASLLSVSVAFAAADPPFPILGVKPKHVIITSTPPNAQAFAKAVWMPGIDEGYVPQGLTVAENGVLISGYRSTSTAVGSGPCRVFRIDPAGGKTTGWFDLPASCKHAGGLAYIGKGVLVAGDTRRLYKIDLEKAFADQSAQNAIQAELLLAGKLKASSLAWDGKNLFLCSYSKKAEESHGWYIALSAFDQPDAATLGVTEADAGLSFPVPAIAQGAAFDARGALWMTQSGSRSGALTRMDPKNGAVLARYDMIIGIEDISFDKNGRVWSVSEAGSLRWSRWTAIFPVVFALDLDKLLPAAR